MLAIIDHTHSNNKMDKHNNINSSIVFQEQRSSLKIPSRDKRKAIQVTSTNLFFYANKIQEPSC